MENASKALLMAATILIAVMLISLGTYLFATFGNNSKNVNDNINQKTKQEFNAQFTKYETKSDYNKSSEKCTVYDITTVINLAHDNNESYEEYRGINKNTANADPAQSYIYVNVNLKNKPGYNYKINQNSSEEVLRKFIADYNTTSIDSQNNVKYNSLFSCTVEISDKTGLVYKIYFQEL